MLVCWPFSDGQGEFLMVYIYEAGGFHPAFEQWTGTRFHVRFAHGIDEFVIEFQRRVFGFERAVRGLPCKIEVDEFNIAVGFCISENRKER